ncbi:hypothetical protein N4G41_10150 [Kosakonia sacchari]|uniref:hypothetical protein n=1 Tax=Kosakonia sacchari TaxID=1158459 RepID=UPI002ACDEE1B|nr:hypothetical protein [Kosakonia sacchari]MDZ7321995.1 hypothetical protein [Kosakonia sacchari]
MAFRLPCATIVDVHFQNCRVSEASGLLPDFGTRADISDHNNCDNTAMDKVEKK